MNVIYGMGPSGNPTPLKCDANGNVNLSYGSTQYASAALEKSAVVKASAGRFRKVRCVNNDVVDNYVQVFDAAALPANATAAKLSKKVPAGDEAILEFDLDCATGIVVALSSTAKTLTLVATNVADFSVRAD